MTRLVLIDNTKKTLSIYENKVCRAVYEVEDTNVNITAEVVEELRVADYPEKA